jgi:hypothetical protein
MGIVLLHPDRGSPHHRSSWTTLSTLPVDRPIGRLANFEKPDIHAKNGGPERWRALLAHACKPGFFIV